VRLTIGIPTYNRALKLKIQLDNLLNLISKSLYKDSITLFVSNNGSIDNTIDILNEYKDKFAKFEILFYVNNFIRNQGFDNNIYFLYNQNKSNFIWFLSDDDRIQENALNQIFLDIDKYNPDIIYYNFYQKPFFATNPYIEKTIFTNNDTTHYIKKIIDFPKLTSLIFKNKKICNYHFRNNLGFAHIEYVILNTIPNGSILLSNNFIAGVQEDYLENITFAPYIGNDLNQSIMHTLEQINKIELYNVLKIEYTDPLTSSLNMLSAYYRGTFVLIPELKNVLLKTIRYEFKARNITLFFRKIVLFEIFKYILSYLIFLTQKIYKSIINK